MTQPRRPFTALAALGMAGFVAACGGGADDNVGTIANATALATTRVVATADVQLEGCVLDNHGAPAAAAAVHARAVDGRLLSTAYSNAEGVYVIRVPAHSPMVLNTSVDAAGELALNTGGIAFSVGACMRTSSA